MDPLSVDEHKRSKNSQANKDKIPRWRDDPAKFIPERWLDEDGSFNPNAGSSMVFGAGPRGCFGESSPRVSLMNTTDVGDRSEMGPVGAKNHAHSHYLELRLTTYAPGSVVFSSIRWNDPWAADVLYEAQGAILNLCDSITSLFVVSRGDRWP